MVILVNEEMEEGFWVRFLRVEVEELESESVSSVSEPEPAEETLEATEEIIVRSTWNLLVDAPFFFF